ncbi:hypothetical protein [Stenotrophomonas nematodicola]|uniref:Uncharacterized protein n=1 Tax=Stenotrophomonas nematodicola TaxID=2656746 RepID=A0ABW7CW74_9GAMM
MLSLFRRKHDYGNFDLGELMPELEAFGITTVKRFRRLLKKHRRSILDEERTKMSRVETLHLLSQFDRRGIDAHSNTSWYAIVGLVRQAMEREFGWEAMMPFHVDGGSNEPPAGVHDA